MDYYEQIKGLFISNEVYKKIKDYSKNKSEVETYYNGGRLIVEAQGGEVRAKYGSNLIKNYSERLVVDFNDKKYSYRNLMNMRKFYLLFRDEKVNALRSQLSWSHYRELLSLDNYNEIKYYIKITMKNNLGYRELKTMIKNEEYKRLSVDTLIKLTANEKLEVSDLIPNPILIKNKSNIEVTTEKILKNLILENIEDFMRELGNSFCFIGSEYKIKIGDNYHKIDLLLFNIKYNAYVVVELKVVEFKVEYISQVQKYMNYIDKNVKDIDDNKTVGIIICRENDKYVIDYCSDNRIIAREYEVL